MKRHTKQTLAVAGLAFAASAVAHAHGDGHDGRPCSEATLNGLYVFSATGYNIVGGAAQPKAINEQIRFNGDGTLTSPVATVSINGAIIRSTATPGSYTLASNCAGSLAFTGGPTFDVIADPRGGVVFMIQTAPGTPVLQGTAERVDR
jgi:hypothetical protein